MAQIIASFFGISDKGEAEWNGMANVVNESENFTSHSKSSSDRGLDDMDAILNQPQAQFGVSAPLTRTLSLEETFEMQWFGAPKVSKEIITEVKSSPQAPPPCQDLSSTSPNGPLFLSPLLFSPVSSQSAQQPGGGSGSGEGRRTSSVSMTLDPDEFLRDSFDATWFGSPRAPKSPQHVDVEEEKCMDTSSLYQIHTPFAHATKRKSSLAKVTREITEDAAPVEDVVPSHIQAVPPPSLCNNPERKENAVEESSDVDELANNIAIIQSADANTQDDQQHTDSKGVEYGVMSGPVVMMSVVGAVAGGVVVGVVAGPLGAAYGAKSGAAMVAAGGAIGPMMSAAFKHKRKSDISKGTGSGENGRVSFDSEMPNSMQGTSLSTSAPTSFIRFDEAHL